MSTKGAIDVADLAEGLAFWEQREDRGFPLQADGVVSG